MSIYSSVDAYALWRNFLDGRLAYKERARCLICASRVPGDMVNLCNKAHCIEAIGGDERSQRITLSAVGRL